MPTPVFPTAYQVECRGALFGQQIENVWHCQGPDPFDAGAASNIASIFQTAYGALGNAISQDYTLAEVFVHNLAGVASGEFTLAIIPPQAGNLPNPSLPGNVAFCVSLRTALAGRTTRGRKFFAGMDETLVTGNVLDSDAIGTLVSETNALINALIDNNTPLSIFSKTALTLVPVTTATAVDNVVDSQRRRLTGRGR